MIVPSREVRTQEFAMPLFVALAYLLVDATAARHRGGCTGVCRSWSCGPTSTAR